MHVQISVDISVQFQKNAIADIANFAISAANILQIRYIGTPLILLTLLSLEVNKKLLKFLFLILLELMISVSWSSLATYLIQSIVDVSSLNDFKILLDKHF